MATQYSDRIELLRLTLLIQASRASRLGTPISTFHLAARVAGFEVTLRDVERELLYLLDKGLLVEVPKVISPENVHYRIHATGRDLLAKQQLDG